MVEPTEDKSVEKRCRGNRYCSFSGPFYPQHLLVVGEGRPRFLGRCYSDGCGAFVCSRCAHRRPPDRPLAGLPEEARVLCCPFHGEPLGRGDEWLVLDGKGEVLDRVSGALDAHTFDETKLTEGNLQSTLESSAMSLGMLAQGIEALDTGQVDVALHLAEQVVSLRPDHPLALLLRHKCLDKSGDYQRSWQALRTLLRQSPLVALTVILEVELLAKVKANRGEPTDAGEDGLLRYREELRTLVVKKQVEIPAPPAAIGPGPWESWQEKEEAELPRPGADAAETVPEIDRLIDPRLGRIAARFQGRNGRRTWIVLGHEYLLPEQQGNLYLQLEEILALAGETPILAEGFEGPRKRRWWTVVGNPEKRRQRALDLLAKSGRLATEVLARLHPTKGVIHGVDDPELRAAQQQLQQKLDSVIRSSIPRQPTGEKMTREAFVSSSFDLLASLLQEVMRSSVNPRLAESLALGENLTGQGKLVTAMSRLAALAQQADLAIDTYPSVEAIIQASEIEGRLDFRVVEQERLALVEALSGHASGPLPSDRRKAVRKWLEKDAAAPLAAPGQPIASEAWFERLVGISGALQQGRISSSQYYERLNGLLTALGVDLAAYRHLQTYVEYLRWLDLFDRNRLLLQELPSLTMELVDRFVSSGSEHGIVMVHRQLGELRKLLELQLPAARVRSLLAEDPSAVDCITDLVRLCEHLLDESQLDDPIQRQYRQLAAVCAPILDKALPHVRDYYFHACRRSVEIARRTLAWPAGPAPLAVLVCGRFHLHHVLRALCNDGASWALVIPKCGKIEAGGLNRGWQAPDVEWVPV